MTDSGFEIDDHGGDRKTDVAIYRASTEVWLIAPSSGVTTYGIGWGDMSDDILVNPACIQHS